MRAKDTISLKSSLSANNIRIAKCDSVAYASRAQSSTNTASTVLPGTTSTTVSTSSQSAHVAQLYDQITTKRSNFYNTLPNMPHVPPRDKVNGQNSNQPVPNQVQRRNTLSNVNANNITTNSLKPNSFSNLQSQTLRPISVIQSDVYDELPARNFEIPEKIHLQNSQFQKKQLEPSPEQAIKLQDILEPSDYRVVFTKMSCFRVK